MIELDHLVAGYEELAITPALSGVIAAGSMTAIVGLNGCGKSTLLKTLAGFIPPVSGRLRWTVSRPVIGWLAQRHALESQFPLTVQDVVSQGAWPHVSLLGGIRSELRRRIGAALERVGLTSMAKTPIEALSGGQFQRMLFARVIVQQAPLAMLDEPFTGMAVLHDNQRVAEYFPETLLLEPQRARWGNTDDVLPAFGSARLA